MRIASVLLVLLSACFLGAERDSTWVGKRVREIRASDTEGWRKIPWADSLPGAARVAEREKRPLFLFSHEGNIDTGRC